MNGKLHRVTDCRKCRNLGHYASNCPFTESEGTEEWDVTEGMRKFQVDDDDYMLESESDDSICFLHTVCLMSTNSIEDLTLHNIF